MTGQTFHVTGRLTLRRNPTAAEIQASDCRGRTGQLRPANASVAIQDRQDAGRPRSA